MNVRSDKFQQLDHTPGFAGGKNLPNLSQLYHNIYLSFLITLLGVIVLHNIN